VRNPKFEIRKPKEARSPCRTSRRTGESGNRRSNGCALAVSPSRRLPVSLALFCLLPLTFCLCAQAQYSLDWSTIDAGGGTSTGGQFSLSGTIGQPDAGTLTGGSFTLQGGFWSLPAMIPAPSIMIRLNNDGTVTLEWPGGGTLQVTPSLDSPVHWAEIIGATSPYTFTPTDPTIFCRISQ
jgi:hypothetical protein